MLWGFPSSLVLWLQNETHKSSQETCKALNKLGGELIGPTDWRTIASPFSILSHLLQQTPEPTKRTRVMLFQMKEYEGRGEFSEEGCDWGWSLLNLGSNSSSMLVCGGERAPPHHSHPSQQQGVSDVGSIKQHQHRRPGLSFHYSSIKQTHSTQKKLRSPQTTFTFKTIFENAQ